MSKIKRTVALGMSVLVLLSGMAGLVGTASAAEETVELPQASESYYVVGRFQQEGSIVSAGQPAEGQVKVDVDSAALVDIREYDPTDLAVQVELRATRHDGVTGTHSLQWFRNGRLTLTDSTGNEVLRTGSPVQQGVAASDRIAGEWMTATFSLATMTESSGRLAGLSLFDYNDFPHQDIHTGITLEVRNACIVNTALDAEGDPIPQYTKATFDSFSGTYHYNGKNLWYADWKDAHLYPVDVSDDLSRYALQMTVTFASEDDTVDLDTCWSNLTIKLRSEDKSGVENDPSGADNKEHNIGWDLTPSQLDMENGTARLSIPLNTPSTNSRGVIDWSTIRRIITIGTVSGSAADKISNITMTLSGVQIVDLQVVNSVREALKAAIDTRVDTALYSEIDRAMYQAALANAQTIYADETALVAEIQNAMGVLKQTLPATEAQKADLQNWITRTTDWESITDESESAYRVAVAAGQALLERELVSRTAVDQAINAAQTAWLALEFDNSVAVLDYGNVDGKDGVTAADALLALQAATGKIDLSEEQTMLANVDGQGEVTANDALLILQYATKKIDRFTVQGEDLSQATTAVENTDPLTFTNPIDISYMFQRANNDANREDGQATYRESADPAIVVFKGKYYLFASHGNGYWSSTDLADWDFIEVDTPTHEEDPNFTELNSQFRKYAPATCVVGDTLYLCHSEGGNMLKSTNPDDPNSWELVATANSLGGWMDPGMFYDDPATGGDGYVYLYMGLSHRDPIRVIKLDPNNNMAKVDGPYDCAWPDKYNRGFEVAGDTNSDYNANDTQEGAWVVKHDGRYYLMCAVPGTQYATYSNSCFVSDSPMGPFTYCENSPVTWKATGFIQGAGHGGLFQDLNGHWWAVQTCRIAGFERRLVLVPAVFDESGDLYTNTVMTDYPMYIPTENEDPFHNMGPGWNLLSYGKEATASSNAGSASLAFNETMTNAWVAETGDMGEWLQADLGRVYGVWSVQVNFADKGFTGMGGRDNDYAYRYLMEFSQDGETWYTMVDRAAQTEDLPHEYIEFAEKIGVRYVRITNKGDVPADGKFAISGLRIFGESGGKAPGQVDIATVLYERRPENNRSIGISWEAVPGAQGYIIRYGTSPDELYTHYQVIGATTKVINSLNRGVDYYFTIDAYNENGVTPGRETFKAEATEPLQSGYDVDGNNPAEGNKAADIVVHEAETAAFGGEGVTVEYEVRASGAKALHGMGSTDTYAEFTNVAGGTKGTATLRISYAAIKTSKAAIKVNGVSVGELTLPKTSGWPTYATVDMNLTGVAETNTIRVEGVGEAFHLDWVQMVYDRPATDDPDQGEGEDTGVAPFEGLADPVQAAGYTVYEAEEAEVGIASIANDAKASGGKSVHSMERDGSYVEFTNVDGGSGGSARLRLSYCEGNAAGHFRLILNGKTVVETKLTNTGTWNDFKMIEFALEDVLAGETNTIRLECGGDGYNPDWIQLICERVE